MIRGTVSAHGASARVHARGWTEELIRLEATLGTVEIVDGRPRRPRSGGRTDYTLWVKVEGGTQPVAVAVLWMVSALLSLAVLSGCAAVEPGAPHVSRLLLTGLS